MLTLTVEWRRLIADGNTCARCNDTGDALRRVLQKLATELEGEGVVVRLAEVTLGPENLSVSNLILLNGRPLEDWIGATPTETDCQSCCDMLGGDRNCRAIQLDATVYESIPESLIRQAALAALSNQGQTMKNIKVLGSGCANCENTLKLIRQTAESMGVSIQLEKVTDIAQILGYGVMSTPGVVIDGKVVHAGGVPSKSVVEDWLKA